MTDTKRAIAANNGNRPLTQKQGYSIRFTGTRQAANDNKSLAEQKAQDIDYSKRFEISDIEILKSFFPTLAKIEVVTDLTRQFAGIDYLVTYTEPRTNAPMTARIDAKRRKAGTCRYWRNKNVPELTFEVRNNGGRFVSCITDPNERTDFYLFTFDDTAEAYLVPFQMARFVLSQPLAAARWRAAANSNGSGAQNVFIPVDAFFLEFFKAQRLPAWLLSRLSVNLAEAATLQSLRSANDNNGNERIVINGAP